MAGKGGRHRLTTEQRAARELEWAQALGLESTLHRIDFYRRLRPLVERSVTTRGTLCTLAVGRGERWSATYSLRQAERELAEINATLAALEAWAKAQPQPPRADYDAPAGAGEEVEAYRG